MDLNQKLIKEGISGRKVRLCVQCGVTHLSSASQRQDLHNLLKFLLFLLGGHCDWIVFFSFHTKQFLTSGLFQKGAVLLECTLKYLLCLTSHALGNWLCSLCFFVQAYISTVYLRVCSHINLFLRDLLPIQQQGKSQGPVLLTSFYKNWQSEHEMLPLIMKELVWKVEKHQLDPQAHTATALVT